jgi:hemerythrin superfamily protein
MPFLCSKPIIGRSKISLPDMRALGILAPSILLAEQVFTELVLHTQLEEHVFYPAYEAMTGQHGTQLVADSRLAHEHVRELMSELQGIDLDEAAFEVKFQELMGIVREHVAEEENVMFPEAEQMLADHLEDLMEHMVELKHHLTSSPQQ